MNEIGIRLDIPIIKKYLNNQNNQRVEENIQTSASSTKFFEDDSRVIVRSPESPQGVSPAGFFVSVAFRNARPELRVIAVNYSKILSVLLH